MDKSVKFWNRVAEKYSNQPIADPEIYQKKLEMTKAILTPTSSVLEFGAGTGSTALIHAERVEKILAIDSSEEMVAIAKRRASEIGVKNVEFQAATLFEISDKPESFDVILGLNILHLIRDVDGTLARVSELLRPGGVFVTSTACLAENLKILKYVLPIGSKLGLCPYVNVFDIATLKDSIVRAGFENVEEMDMKDSCFVISRKFS